MFQPLVAKTERTAPKSQAASKARKPLEILILTFIMRKA
jgi:hypothetical protein